MTRVAALAILALLALTGCQTPPSNDGGGINGYEHPRAGDYQSDGPLFWMAAAGVLLIAGGLALRRRADR